MTNDKRKVEELLGITQSNDYPIESYDGMVEAQQTEDDIAKQERLSDPSYGTGAMLARPNDASEDFMKFLRNPLPDIPQEGGLPPAPEAAQEMPPEMSPEMSQASMMSKSKVSNTIGGSTPPAPVKGDFRDDFLAQLKALRESNQNALNEGRENDNMVNLRNIISEGGSQMSQGIANRGGYTDIKLNPLKVDKNFEKNAIADNESKLAGVNEAYKLMSDKEKARIDAEDKNEDRKYKNRLLELQKLKTKSEKTEADSAGQKKLDTEFAKDYNEYTSKGRSNAVRNISKLESIRDQLLKEGDGLLSVGGGRSSMLPNALRSRTSLQWKTDAQNSANTTLKELFGGQLSDAEREAAAKEYYNDELPNATNAEILTRKIEDLKAATADKDEKAKYFQSNKATLKGFTPSASKELSPSSTGKVKVSNGKETLEIDQSDLADAEADGYKRL